MTTLIEAAQQALEALEKCESALAEELAAWDIDPPLHHVLGASHACGPAIKSLRQAIEQAQKQEPVIDKSAAIRIATALGWTPPQQEQKPVAWVDLSTTAILDIYQEVLKEWRGGHQVNGQIAFARALEAKIKEVNT